MTARARTGDAFLLASVLLEGLFPVIIHTGVRTFPPLFFAAVSILLSSMIFACMLWGTGTIRQEVPWRVFGYLLVVVACIVVIPYIFILEGARLTSGVNTALLLQMEIPFAFLICGIFFGERMGSRQFLGAAVAVLGAAIIVWRGESGFRLGDLLIVAGTAFYPIGNVFAKKALRELSPLQVLAIRSSIGGLILLIISAIAERASPILLLRQADDLWLIILNATVILTLSKICWYSGLSRASVVRATSFLSVGPAVGLLATVVLLREIPTLPQLIGFLLTMAGLWILTRAPRAAAEPL